MDEIADTSEPAPLPLSARTTADESAQSDFELANLAGSGDEAAFEELFKRHKRRVALIASRFFRQREQIEEIVQESFAKAFFALGDFSNQQEASFAAWIARIAFNVCYDELRRLKRRPESALRDVSGEESEWLKEQLLSEKSEQDVEAEAVSRDLADKLLSHLSPEDRLVLVMLEVEGMTVNEIARSTNWSNSKVKVRAHRARASLRRILHRFL